MKNRFLVLTIILFLFTTIMGNFDLNSCTIIAVGKKASKDGSVMVSHTDCGPDSRQGPVRGNTRRSGLARNCWR